MKNWTLPKYHSDLAQNHTTINRPISLRSNPYSNAYERRVWETREAQLYKPPESIKVGGFIGACILYPCARTFTRPNVTVQNT